MSFQRCAAWNIPGYMYNITLRSHMTNKGPALHVYLQYL